MTNQEIKDLVEKYFNTEGYQFPQHFEHRLDPDSSAVLYSFIRHFKPNTVLEAGSWFGGSTAVIMAALLKNEQEFTFICSELDDGRRGETEKNVLEICGQAPTMVGDITKVLPELPEKIDFAFIDTDHDLDTTKWIVKHIFPKISKEGIYSMHDWAVEEKEGMLIGKGRDGAGGWPETQYLMDLHTKGTFPFKKVYWNYHNPGDWETAFWQNV